MTDREKIIKWLEICGKNMDYSGSCPYGDGSEACEDSFCREALMTDALALIKEQEQRINRLEETLRLLEYGNQDILQSGLMSAT